MTLKKVFTSRITLFSHRIHFSQNQIDIVVSSERFGNRRFCVEVLVVTVGLKDLTNNLRNMRRLELLVTQLH